MNDLISIVLPVYNGAQFLRESIDSVLAQTHQNWELLILDDCSTDDTHTIAKEYQAKDLRIQYHRNETNLKLPGNLNRGFSLAKGDYLTWTSDDNRYRPNALEKMLAELKRTEVQLVYASMQLMDADGTYTNIFRASENGAVRILGNNPVGACFLYTRAVYEKVGDYDTDLFLVEDFDYWQRVFMHFPVKAMDEVLYDYRQHGGSLTNQMRRTKFGAALEKMLLKNRAGFGRISLEASFYYYSELKRSRTYQGKKNPDEIKYRILALMVKVRRLFNKA